MRKLIYSYGIVLGILKMLIYKVAFGKSLFFEGIPHFEWSASLRLRQGSSFKLRRGGNIAQGSIICVTNGGKMSVGYNSTLSFNCIVTCMEKIVIGNNVMIGPGLKMFDHDHDFYTDDNYNEKGYRTGEINIEDNVWLGCNVTILKGVTIGKNSVIAAGSVITRSIPANSIYRNKISPVISPIK